MGKISTPLPVKLFTGVITSMPDLVAEVEAGLSGSCGPVDLRSEAYPFDLTSYYDRDMGTPLRRFFLGFRDLVSPEALVKLKLQANELEADMARRSQGVPRPVNVDPGYLEEAKIVLASTKNFTHRIYLAGGIYAEVTLHYQDRGWRHYPWTFPDFRSGRYDAFFSELRRIYMAQLRSCKP